MRLAARTIVAFEEYAGIVSAPGPRLSDEDRLEEARVLLKLAQDFRANERADNARRFARRALAIFERVWGPDHPEVILALLCVGGAREDLADYRRAGTEYQRAEEILDRISGDFDDLDVRELRVQTDRGLASVARALDRQRESEATLMR